MRGALAVALIALPIIALALAPAVLGQGSAIIVPVTTPSAALWGSDLLAVSGNQVVFISLTNRSVVKAVGFESGGRAYIELFPPTSPSTAFVWSPVTGVELLVDRSLNVLYRAVMGFGRLLLAWYSYGYIYSLIQAASGRQLWIRSLVTGEWFYVAPQPSTIANARPIALGQAVSIAPSPSGRYVYVLLRPTVPPGASGVATLVVHVINTSGALVKKGSVAVYVPRYNFTTPAYSVENGVARVRVPAPFTTCYIFVKAGKRGLWYEEKLRIFVAPGRVVDVAIVVPTKTVGYPPRTYPLYVVKLMGPGIVWKRLVPPTVSSIIAAGPDYAIAVSGSSVEFVFEKRVDTVHLDYPPLAACVSPGGSYVAVLTQEGTLYLFRVAGTSVDLLATYSVGAAKRPEVPWLGPVACGESVVVVSTSRGVQAISLASLKELFRYTYPALNLTASSISFSGGRPVIVAKGGVVILPRLEQTAPFNAMSLLPAKLIIQVLSPWHRRPVAGARVYIDGVYACTTGSKGTCEASVSYGVHTIRAVPPANESMYMAPASERVRVSRSSMRVSIVLGRNAFVLKIVVLDPVTRILRQPVNLTVIGPVNRSVELVHRLGVSLFLPRGNYTIIASPSTKPAIYGRKVVRVRLVHDTNVTIVMPLAKYVVSVSCFDEATHRPVPCVAVYGGRNATRLVLPYGKHRIKIVPLPRIKGVPLYGSTTETVFVKGNTTIRVPVKRIYAVLRIHLVDEMTGKCPRQEIPIYVGFTKIGAKCNATALVRVGKVRLRIGPTPLYGMVEKTIDVYEDTNITIRVPRRMYPVSIYVVSSIGRPVAGARVSLTCTENPRYSYVIVTDSHGTASARLPECVYRVTVSGPNIYSKSLMLDPAIESSITVHVPISIIGFFEQYGSAIIIASSMAACSFGFGWFLLAKVRKSAARHFARPETTEEVPLEQQVSVEEWERRARESEEGGA